MDRDNRRDDRDHKQRHERDRSRSPQHRERRDDRRRDRSPFRGGARGGRGGGRGGGAPPYRSDRDNNNTRGRDRGPSDTPPPPSHRGGRGGARQFFPHPNNPPGGPRNNAAPQPPKPGRNVPAAPEISMTPLEGEDEEALIARIMGFQKFRSTKNTKVPGNERNYAVSKVKKAEYRQYMNRVGGFNRPLSPTRGAA
ncbi:hypothetical protein B0A55_10778 [Friedmanniomyces simplex]|uniref:U4/U6.U5 small nuclear ribonucleoprotein 27kDa protein domain-containing protein n=1 Tax=Friedmanniomyces simplex TaxID=329884 RepID=A0A4U0WR06_9PEZI|nr:hypothetical protein B0A55_10778 [Friedmanniomyces simplex]